MKNSKENQNSFIAPIIEIDGELAIEFSDEMMKTLDLSVGDTIEYVKNSDESYFIEVVKK